MLILQIIGMERIKSKLIICQMMLTLLFSGCAGQSSTVEKNPINCCVESQLSSMGKSEATPTLISGSKNYSIDGHSLSIDEETLKLNEHVDLVTSNSLKEWLEKINTDSIKVYSLSTKGHQYFIVRSQIRAATGLAANFYNWLLIDSERASIVGFDLMSLSNDVRMFHLANGVLYVILLNFADEFILGERDFNNVPVTISTYKLQKNLLAKTNEINISCKCE